MGSTPKIPFSLETENVIPPVFFGEFNGKFVYNLFTSINGNDIKTSAKFLNVFINLIIPFGISCSLKHIFFEENGNLLYDEKLDRGLLPLKEGGQFRIYIKLPDQLDRTTIKKGQIIAQLIFEQKVDLIRYWSCVKTNNILRFKRLNSNAFRPVQVKESAGIDLPSALRYELPPKQTITMRTQLAFAIPKGFYGRIIMRSGIAQKYSVDAIAGCIDPGFRGEISIILVNHGMKTFIIEPGDRVAQMVIQPYTDCVMVECDLEKTERDNYGFGSTGINQLINFNEESSANISKELQNTQKEFQISDPITLDFAEINNSNPFELPNYEDVCKLFE